MDHLPTLIVTMQPSRGNGMSTSAAWSARYGEQVRDMAELGIQCGLRTVCVLPAGTGAGLPQLPLDCSLLEAPLRATGKQAAHWGLLHAIQATAHSAGWLVFPAHAPRPAAATLRAVSEAIKEYPIAIPYRKGIQGYPVGFSQELYSELMHLRVAHDFDRLVARYPAAEIPA